MNRAELEKILEEKAKTAKYDFLIDNALLKAEIKVYRLYAILMGLVCVALYVLYLIG